MFHHLTSAFRSPSPQDANGAFVADVQVKRIEPRSRRAERLLLVGWLLIALKCWATFWVVHHYAMPFNPWWIVAPTVAAAAACTWIYVRRN